MTDRSHLLSSYDAAMATGVKEATLRDWVRRGLLPRYGTPRRALYDWRDLENAMRQPKPRRVGAGSLDDAA